MAQHDWKAYELAKESAYRLEEGLESRLRGTHGKARFHVFVDNAVHSVSGAQTEEVILLVQGDQKFRDELPKRFDGYRVVMRFPVILTPEQEEEDKKRVVRDITNFSLSEFMNQPDPVYVPAEIDPPPGF